MDGHHIADPWDLPETPNEPEAGAVATAPTPAKAALFSRRPGEEHHTPVDDAPQTDPSLAGDLAGPVAEFAPARDAASSDEEGPEGTAREHAVALGEAEPLAMVDETPAEPASPRFDLGLDPTEIGDMDDEPIGDTADFGLFLPVADTNPEREYEVSPPDLDDKFVTSNGPGRPDLGAPHLRDPMTIFAIDESAMPGEPPVPGASLVSLVDEAGAVELTDADPATADDDGTPSETDDPTAATKGFRLPGLTLFGRNRDAEVDPTGDASLDPEDDGVGGEADTKSVTPPGVEATETDADTAPREPVAWSTMSNGAVEPEGGPPNPFRTASMTTPEGGTADQVEAVSDPLAAPPTAPSAGSHIAAATDPFSGWAPSATEQAETSQPPADTATGRGPGDVEVSPTAGAFGDELDPRASRANDDPKADDATLAADPTDHEVTVTEDEPAWPVAEEDVMEIGLTDPDLSEFADAEQMYVTEEVLAGHVRTALLTVDSVPGATIARALDIVTAVASAPSADDIAGAMGRAMEQLRDRATELGGRAVISVRSEVQEIGGGFLVTASGTAVDLD